jgi:hypothetical protein
MKTQEQFEAQCEDANAYADEYLGISRKDLRKLIEEELKKIEMQNQKK